MVSIKIPLKSKTLWTINLCIKPRHSRTTLTSFVSHPWTSGYKIWLIALKILTSFLSPVTNSSDVFTNLFHEFFPRIFHSQSKKKTNFASWKRNRNRYFFKKFVDSEFEIGETIWWICTRIGMGLWCQTSDFNDCFICTLTNW